MGELSVFWPILAAMAAQTLVLVQVNKARLEAVEQSTKRAHERIDGILHRN